MKLTLFFNMLLLTVLGLAVGCGDEYIANSYTIQSELDGTHYLSPEVGIADYSDANIEGSLAWIIAQDSMEPKTIVFQGDYTYPILQNLVIPENVQLRFQSKALLNVGAGALLDVRGYINDPMHCVFDVSGTLFLRNSPYIRPQWFGATGDGLQDDTRAIQQAIDCAAQLYNQVSYPPAGDRFNPPIVLLAPGSYRLTHELVLYSGLTLSGEVSNPFTNGHTRLIMDLSGNNEYIIRSTRVFEGTQRTQNCTFTIQDLEFWYVPVGGSIDAPYGAGYGNDSLGNPLYSGCAINISEQCIDVRIKRCNFYQSPDAAIRLAANLEEPGARTRSLVIDECEFDSGNRFIRGETVRLDLIVNSCKFFGGNDQFLLEECTGNLMITSSIFEVNAQIRVERSTLQVFQFTSNAHTDSGPKGFIHLDRAQMINISANSFGLTTQSTIHILYADAGSVAGNTINNSGFNTPYQTPEAVCGQDNVPAAIRLTGCQNVVVAANSISTSDESASFGGFGIYTRDCARASQGNLVVGNRVSGRYNGSPWRNQNRKVNIAPGDTQSENLID